MQSRNLAGNVFEAKEPVSGIIINNTTTTLQDEIHRDDSLRVDTSSEVVGDDTKPTACSQAPRVGYNIFAKLSRMSQNSFKLIGGILSMFTVGYLKENAGLTQAIIVIVATLLDCHFFAYILFFFHAPHHIWAMPYFYGSVNTSFLILEIYDKPRRFCHRNVLRLFSYHVREIHIDTMLWVRPLVSLYFGAILSCMLLTLQSSRDFEGILIRMMSYYFLWEAIANYLFHLTAHSDPNLLSAMLPDQRTTAEIHNLHKTIIAACTPDDQLLDVLKARENHIWRQRKNTLYLLSVQEMPLPERADENV